MGGCCCRCCPRDESASSEAEMTANLKPPSGKSLSISRAMSAPTVELEGRNVVRTLYRYICVVLDLFTFSTRPSPTHCCCSQVSGSGLALAGVSIEQDAAYWEWHMQVPDGLTTDVMFGVTTRKNAAFYKSLDEQGGDGASCRAFLCLTFSRHALVTRVTWDCLSHTHSHIHTPLFVVFCARTVSHSYNRITSNQRNSLDGKDTHIQWRYSGSCCTTIRFANDSVFGQWGTDAFPCNKSISWNCLSLHILAR